MQLITGKKTSGSLGRPLTAGSAAALALTAVGCGENSIEAVTTVDYKTGSFSADSGIEVDAETPNIVYIVLDDAGFSDLGSYGSEISTPRMDELAANGIRYNTFCTTPLSSPTRASLLTGRNSHAVGMGHLANFDMGTPNQRAEMTHAAATLAEILQSEGYGTYAAGKWHLVNMSKATQVGPFDNWPVGRGFNHYYGFLEGEATQYTPEVVIDNTYVGPPESGEYHFSEAIVDRSIGYVADQVSLAPDKPFFLYLAFGAPHDPHHAPPEYIEKYKGVYDRGWDEIRRERFEKQKQMGIIPGDAELAPRNADVKAWTDLTSDEQRLAVRYQETYAAYLEHTDDQIGRFLDFLESTGRMEDTLIVLLSDNGGSSTGGSIGRFNGVLKQNGVKSTVDYGIEHIDEIGSPTALNHYPTGWAQVSNTPFREYKQRANYMGGIRAPLIIHWPAYIRDKGAVREQFHHVTDITPTVLDILNIDAPEEYKGVEQIPLHGISMLYTFADGGAPTRKEVQYIEINGERSVWADGWFAMSNHVRRESYDKDQWQLYNLNEDFSQLHDVAAEYPGKLEELKKAFEEEAEKYGVYPLDDRTIAERAATLEPLPGTVNYGEEFTFYPGMTYLNINAMPRMYLRTYSISPVIELTDRSQEGVLWALGGIHGGMTIYIRDNRAVFEYTKLDQVFRIVSDIEVPLGKSVIKYEYRRDRLNAFKPGTGTLYINGQAVGETEIAGLPITPALEGATLGYDGHTPVSDAYEGQFVFTGKIEKVDIKLNKDQANLKMLLTLKNLVSKPKS